MLFNQDLPEVSEVSEVSWEDFIHASKELELSMSAEKLTNHQDHWMYATHKDQ